MTAEDDTPTLRLALGEVVVYGFHGVGRVTARVGDGAQQTIVLEFGSGLRVTLPVERARMSVRALSSRLDLARVAETLAVGNSPTEPQWSKRFRATREKVVAGQVIGLAEVVREGAQRERRLASRPGVMPSPAEHELYRRARQLLTDEISASRGIDRLDADQWITTQLGRGSSESAPG